MIIRECKINQVNGITTVVLEERNDEYYVYDRCEEGVTLPGFTFNEVYDDLTIAWGAATGWADALSEILR